MQPKFMKSVAGGLVLFALVMAAHQLLNRLPDREVGAAATAPIRYEPVVLEQRDFAPFVMAGAWSVSSLEPRFGGISALALDGETFVALADSGTVLRFPKPVTLDAVVRATELPAGPGSPRFKANRDSEAIARDAEGRGWWVAFEFSHELWLYDDAFTKALDRVAVPTDGFTPNKGVEGLADVPSGLIAAPEGGGRMLRFKNSQWSVIPLPAKRRTSALATLGDGSFIVVERTLTPFGMRNSLAALRIGGAGVQTLWRKPLRLARFDNVEGVAVESRPNGGRRLWLATDNGFNPRSRTLLIALDL